MAFAPQTRSRRRRRPSRRDWQKRYNDLKVLPVEVAREAILKDLRNRHTPPGVLPDMDYFTQDLPPTLSLPQYVNLALRAEKESLLIARAFEEFSTATSGPLINPETAARLAQSKLFSKTIYPPPMAQEVPDAAPHVPLAIAVPAADRFGSRPLTFRRFWAKINEQRHRPVKRSGVWLWRQRQTNT